MEFLLPATVATVIGIAAALATTWMAHREGLGTVSKRADEQQDRLVSALEGRIGVLEAENRRLTEHVRTVEAENEALRIRVTNLERAIADKAVGA